MPTKIIWIVRTLFLSFLAIQNFPNTDAGPHERMLLHHLLDKYNVLERPVQNDTDVLIVKLGFSLLAIDELYFTQQRVITLGLMKMVWTDVNLMWDASEFDNIRMVRVPPHRIWKPDVHLINEGSGYLDNTYASHTIVNNDGLVQYSPPGKFDTFCGMRSINYPYDEHQCKIIFASWSHSAEHIDFELLPTKPADNSSFIPHPNWELLDFGASLGAASNDAHGDSVQPIVSFTFSVKRKGDHIFAQSKLAALILTFLILSSRLIIKSAFKIPFVLFTLAVSIKFWYEFPEQAFLGLGNYFETFTRLCVFFLVVDIVVDFIRNRGGRVPPRVLGWSQRIQSLTLCKALIGDQSHVPVDQVEGVNLTDIEPSYESRAMKRDWGVLAGLLNAISSIILVLLFTVLYTSYFCF